MDPGAGLSSTPQQFGDYHLLEKIATGGMAEVYRARAYGLAGFEKILVIKKVLPSLATDDEFIKLFIDEAKIAVQLLHVNIVQVFELDEVNGQYYMALEYVHGLDLARLVSRAKNRGPFPLPLALFVSCEVLKALAFAHDRTDDMGQPLHIVHCDISPQNILVSYAGEVKITDFGISRAAFQAKSLHDVIRGKYAYMSPEQVDGKALDGRSDIFSLGIVLFELLTGRRLFKAKSRDETIARVRRAEGPSPRSYRPEISSDLEAILLKALAARDEDRYDTASAMLEDLGVLMVREGHRATNNDLSAYVRGVVENDRARAERRQGQLEPSSVVVVACEAFPPPRTLSTPRHTLATLSQEWSGIVAESGGEVWEQSDGSMLLCWVDGELRDTLAVAVRTTLALKQATQRSGYRLSAGVAPGVARVDPESKRPGEGWELAGPFYLARWMMNLSAHRGRPLLTEVGAKQVGDDAQLALLGRISILGNRYINLYEVG
ncbi:MAG TPA: serine/threonine protein kinase [Deltaproteobacteria bacterium]|nr:serine/threonine protein kinase [Deltaproteobacteria bacterium]